jgi:hypothetical protein
MNDQKFIESIGVNEEIRKPPYPENTNDPDSMIRMEGQALGRLGDRHRSWFVILFMWLATGMPVLGFTTILFFSANYNKLDFMNYIIGISMILLCVIFHVPVVQAVITRLRSNQSLKGRM